MSRGVTESDLKWHEAQWKKNKKWLMQPQVAAAARKIPICRSMQRRAG